MSWHRRNNLWRRFTAGLLLVVYATTCAGVVPFPAFAIKKKGGEPFPCQDHECGCATAEDCWRHCCCFTAEERWAWARDHQVQPPEYAERPATKSWSTARLRDQAENQLESSAACTHCQTPPPQVTSCEHSGITSCCPTKPNAQEPRPIDPPSRSHGPALLSAWRCQGLSTVWLTTGAVLPIVPSATWRLHSVCVGWIAGWDARPAILSLVPPDPPPRTL
ncbi:MAG TPA: hypothetical protein VGG61_11640 [Gemmataceae bacterium]